MLRSRISVLTLLLSLAGCGVGEIEDPEHPVAVEDDSASTDSALTVCAPGPVTEGIDVSKWQHTPNWGQVAASGKAFAITKLSQGSVIDPTFQANWDGMKAAGMIRGAYQWFLPNEDPIAQADLAIRVLGRLGPGELPVMADVEAPAPYPAPSVYAARLRQWVDRITAGTGKAPIIYSGYYYWAGALGNTAQFNNLPLAHAQYTLSPCPRIPDVWSRWTIWQYRGGGVPGIPDGSCPGIAGAVDQDHFNGSLADLKAFAGAGGPPPVAPSCGALASGASLAPGQTLTSCGGKATLAHQTDGNVVVYDNVNHKALWSSATAPQATSVLAMQTDGNLVLYAGGTPLWHTHTNGSAGAIAVMQDDGNFVVYGSGLTPLWASNTQITAPPPPPPPPPACGAVNPNTSLLPGQQVTSCGGRFVFAHQTDGNVVLYDRGVAIWHTHTNGRRTTQLAMQGDGNLVLYNGTTPVWYSGTNGHPGAWLAIQGDGNAVIYVGSHPLWASNTAGR
jgi:GH25 family lysozyme M1 (1,4-beta-N-acetylmuramidase)